MSADVSSDVPVGVDDYQLISPPVQLDPRILVALARIVMEGSVATKSHTTALMALTVAAWMVDHFLSDQIAPAPVPGPTPTPGTTSSSDSVPTPGPFVNSPTADQPEAATLMHAAACVAARGEPVEGLPPGVQGALPPVDWMKVLQVLAAILQQIAPLLGSAA